MEEGKLFPTEQGTPQGGVISPLLANIAVPKWVRYDRRRRKSN
jgi:retron-type reverse transcriptase